MTGVTFNGIAAHQCTWLVFRLGPHFLCASALDVEGIIPRPHAIAKVPLTPDYVLGAFLFRGHSAAAISLRRKFKLPGGEERPSAPFIVGRVGAAFVGFCVDEVCDVMEEQDAEWRPLPSSLADAVFQRIAISNGRMILQTRFAELRDAKCEFEAFAASVASAAGRSIAPSPATAAEMVERPAEVNPAAAAAPVQECAPASTLAAVPEAAGDGGSGAAERVAVRLPRLDPGPGERTRRVAKETSRQLEPARQPPVPSGIAAIQPIDNIEAEEMTQAEISARDERAPFLAWKMLRPAAVALLVIVVCATAFYTALSIPSAKALRKPIVSSDIGADNRAIPTAPPELEATRQPATAVSSGTISITVDRSGDRRAAARDAKAAAPTRGDAAAARSYVHTVVRGDTLWQIAKQHVGDPYRYRELARLSHISDPDVIRPGDVVRIEISERK